ncbi:MAG TPA: RNB domain-containing ribonuclease [Acidimicrobiales bacterium]
MPTPRIALAGTVAGAPVAEVAEAMAAVRAELEVPEDFPAGVTAAAQAAATGDLVVAAGGRRTDRTMLQLVTVDPPDSRDLDQAFGAERRPGGGIRVWYAIADVAAFVAPGDPVDVEAHRRGVTLYGPDRRVPLHPPELSEGAASLLPDGDRPALLWCIDLDSGGAPATTRLERATVRSRARLTYAEVADAVSTGTAGEPLTLLREIGELRLAAEAARGGVSLPLPDQVVAPRADGDLELAFDAPVPSEDWNAQVSLLAGIEAARIMVEAGIGLLRTLPPADERDLARLRRSAAALGVAWPEGTGYPEFVRSLDPASPAGAALLVQASRVLRGAGYTGFDGALPAEHRHAAVAAPYAHVTAPLRRLCDRATNEVVLALVEGRAVPEWAGAEVGALPAVMADAGRRDGAYVRAALDLVEALVLRGAVGGHFPALVVDVDDDRVQVQLRDPAVVARARHDGGCRPGDEVDVVVRAADPVARRIDLEVVGGG